MSILTMTWADAGLTTPLAHGLACGAFAVLILNIAAAAIFIRRAI